MYGSRTTAAIAHYDGLLAKKYAVSSQDHLARATERHHLYKHQSSLKNEPLCAVLRPHIIDAATYEAALSATLLVHRALSTVAERLLVDAELARAAGLPEYLDPMLATDRRAGSVSLIARFDGFLDAAGRIKLIEYNSQPSWFEEDELNIAFSTMPIAREFAQQFPFRTVRRVDPLLDTLHAYQAPRGQSRLPTLAVVRDSSAEITQPRFGWWALAASGGCRVLVATPEEFRISDGQLYVNDTRIDLVDVEWDQLLSAPIEAVSTALVSGAVRALFGLSRGLLCNSKVLFEFLSDPTYLSFFDRDVAAALAAHVPWTRRLRECKTPFEGRMIDLIPFVAEHRDRFVIKPSGSAGGDGVVLGWECDQSRWERALKAMGRRPTVVQERVDAQLQSFPVFADGALSTADYVVDFNPYVWGGERALGHCVRMAAGGPLNSRYGAGDLACFVID